MITLSHEDINDLSMIRNASAPKEYSVKEQEIWEQGLAFGVNWIIKKLLEKDK